MEIATLVMLRGFSFSVHLYRNLRFIIEPNISSRELIYQTESKHAKNLAIVYLHAFRNISLVICLYRKIGWWCWNGSSIDFQIVEKISVKCIKFHLHALKSKRIWKLKTELRWEKKTEDWNIYFRSDTLIKITEQLDKHRVEHRGRSWWANLLQMLCWTAKHSWNCGAKQKQR